MSVAGGYGHEGYARSVAGVGSPLALAASGGWLVERSIPGTAARDAMGPYPLLQVSRWHRLAEDLASLSGRLVSVTAVCDPFGDYSAGDLRTAFDVVRPFKTHVVVNLRQVSPSRHHRRSAREALRRVHVEPIPDPVAALDEWCQLYEVLVARHGLSGIHAFTRRAFALQLAVPGLRAFRACRDGRTVAAQLWYVAGGHAYSHLQAATTDGYALGAAYALFAEAFDALRVEADRATLGGGAGLADDPADGLLRFKRGWSTDSVTVPLVGRILDSDSYWRLSALRSSSAGYFPAYRDVVAPAVSEGE